MAARMWTQCYINVETVLLNIASSDGYWPKLYYKTE